MEQRYYSILLCEDDVTVRTLMADDLRTRGFHVDVATDGLEGLEKINASHYDLLLLDIMMPRMNGLEMLQELRLTNRRIPVVIVSARGTQDDLIAGYEAGADDYITKPFSMEVLVCKINALIRRIRTYEEENETQFSIGGLTFDSVHQDLGGVHLSSHENEILLLLCRHANQIVERSHILKSVWKTDNYFASRSLSVFIHHLRSYLKGSQAQLLSVHGKGYKLING
jgi:DNA-binding response OmpR family regulator